MEVDVAGIHKILAKGLNKKGKVNVQSFTGHMSSLSAPQRDHIKNCGNLKGFLQRYPNIYNLKNGSVSLLTQNNEITNMKPSSNYEGAMADDRCAICTEMIEVHATVDCGHTLCYKCAVRWRVINKENDCMYCKKRLTKIIFCNSDDIISAEDLLEGEYGFYYESTKIKKKVESLLKHQCNECTSKFDDCKSLDQHLQQDHRLSFCDICLRYQKFFSNEREIYTLDEILPHHKEKHKLCPYCDIYYFDNDELYHHLTTHHFNCQICNSNTADDEEPHLLYYFRTMEELSEHIQDEHVYCKRCIHDNPQESAFEGEKGLQAHMNYKHLKKKKFSKFDDIDIHMNTRQESMMNNHSTTPLPSGLTHSKIKPTDVKESIGQITGSLNAGYSFIQPHGAQDRSKNVYFDTDSFGLSADDDLRDHFNWGDYVRFESVEHRGHTAGYRATNVTKITCTEYWQEAEKRKNPHTDLQQTTSANLNNQEFPGITTTYSKHTNPAVWPAVKRTTATKLSPLDVKNPTPAATSKNARWISKLHEFGYAYNIKPRFGFITRRAGRSEHDKNVYFNIQSFHNGLIVPQPITSLDKCLSDGVKLYYQLEDKPSTNQSHDTKLRAKKVWRAVLNSGTSAPIAPPLKISITQNQKATDKASKKKPKEKISTKDELQMLDFRDDDAASSSSTPINNKKTSNTNASKQEKFERSNTPRKNSKTNSMDGSFSDVRLISESDSLVVYENITNDSQSSLAPHDANSEAFTEPTTTQYNGQDSSIYLQSNPLEIYGESSQLIAELLANGSTSNVGKKNKLTVPFMEVYESEDEGLSHTVADHMFGNNPTTERYAEADLPNLLPTLSLAPEDITAKTSPLHVQSAVEVKIDDGGNGFVDEPKNLDDKTAYDAAMTQQTAEQMEDDSPLAVGEEDECNKEECLPSSNPTSLHDYGSLSKIPSEEVKNTLTDMIKDVGSHPSSSSSLHEDNSTAYVRRITPKPHARSHGNENNTADEQKDYERKIFEKIVLQKLAQQMTDNFSNKSLPNSEVSTSSSEESSGLTQSSENLPQAELSLHPMGDEFTEEELLVIDQMQQVEVNGEDVKVEEGNSNAPEVGSQSKRSSGYSSNGANSNSNGAQEMTHDQGEDTKASVTHSVESPVNKLMNETINGQRLSNGSSSSGSHDNDNGSSSDDAHAVITAVSDGSSSFDDSVSIETDDSDRLPTRKKNRRKTPFETDSKYFSVVLETVLGKKGLRKLKEVLFDKYLFFNDLCFVSIDYDAKEVFFRYYKNVKGCVQLSSSKKISAVFSLNVDSAVHGLMSRGLITKCDESTFHINKTFHYMIGKFDSAGHVSKLTVHYRSLCKRN